MTENRTPEIAALAERVGQMASYLHIDAKRAELAALEAKAAAPGFWDDQSNAQVVMAQSSALRDEISAYDETVAALSDVETASEFALAEDDDEMAAEVSAGLVQLAKAHRRARDQLLVHRASSTRATPSSRSRPVRAASRPRTGPRCSSRCT